MEEYDIQDMTCSFTFDILWIKQNNICYGGKNFENYWELPTLFLIATVMNPRLNLVGTKVIMKEIPQNLTSGSSLSYGSSFTLGRWTELDSTCESNALSLNSCQVEHIA